MIERQKKNEDLTFAFSHLATHIKISSQQGMVDINKAIEIPLVRLLNNLYSLSLSNLNSIQHNHPAIDLGDDLKGVAVQITSDGSRKKFDATIKKFNDHGLQSKYSQIWFLVISNDSKINFTRPGYDILVLTLSDMAKHICEKDDYNFELIYNYCKREFFDYFREGDASPMAPVSTSSVNPSECIVNFITANQLEKDEYQKATPEEIREDLIDLKNKLSKLSGGQRWFLYHTINYTLNLNRIPDKCFIPVAVIQESIKDKNSLWPVYRSLCGLGLADYDEYNYKVDGSTFEIRCKGQAVDEFDYFTGVAEFLKNQGKQGSLKILIVDCDFSVID